MWNGRTMSFIYFDCSMEKLGNFHCTLSVLRVVLSF
jgi:hypothetical protein